MKKIFTWKNFFLATTAKFFITLCIAGALHFSHAHAAVKVGASAPEFNVKDTNGKEQKLSAYKGKIVVLEWKNHECPFVKKHYGSGNMQALQKYAAEKDVVWLSVISSAPGKQGFVIAQKANEIVKNEGSAATAVILDPEGVIGKSYGAKTTPHMFVIDKEGRLAYMGAIDDNPSMNPEDIEGARNYVKEAIDALLDDNEVETKTSTQYGCSIKY